MTFAPPVNDGAYVDLAVESLRAAKARLDSYGAVLLAKELLAERHGRVAVCASLCKAFPEYPLKFWKQAISIDLSDELSARLALDEIFGPGFPIHVPENP